MNKSISISKLDDPSICEDASFASETMIVISDGAGGGGLYADKWSKYLVDNLPSTPIESFEELDSWIGDIWEQFYNNCEQEAKKFGGLLLNKFYDEGAYATLAAAWKVTPEIIKWMSFGDSVIFCYHQKDGTLEYSFEKLRDFYTPPFLINCKDELNKEGFRKGEFKINEDDEIFACSDALAHYILMMYEVANKDIYESDINEAIFSKTKESLFLSNAKEINYKFYEDVLSPLLNSVSNSVNFKRHISKLRKKNLIAIDDYSLAILGASDKLWQ